MGGEEGLARCALIGEIAETGTGTPDYHLIDGSEVLQLFTRLLTTCSVVDSFLHDKSERNSHHDNL